MSNPKPSVKQQRADRRAAQLAEFKKREAARRRNGIIGRVLAIVGILAVIGVVAAVVVVNSQPKPVLLGLQTWDDLEQTHVDGKANYRMTPPAGGPHNAAWLNCGIYDEVQVDEYAVHSLEHGAVWITYDPETTSEAHIAALRAITPTSHAILSPYPGIGDVFAISAWGAQLRFSDPESDDVAQFIDTYWQSADSPEPGAPCSGAIEGPGRVS